MSFWRIAVVLLWTLSINTVRGLRFTIDETTTDALSVSEMFMDFGVASPDGSIIAQSGFGLDVGGTIDLELTVENMASGQNLVLQLLNYAQFLELEQASDVISTYTSQYMPSWCNIPSIKVHIPIVQSLILFP